LQLKQLAQLPEQVLLIRQVIRQQVFRKVQLQAFLLWFEIG